MSELNSFNLFMSREQIFHRLSVGLLTLLVLLFCGCSVTSRSKEPPSLALAKDAVRQKWGWTHVEVAGAKLVQDRWVIGLWRLPKAPGGMATVEVTIDG